MEKIRCILQFLHEMKIRKMEKSIVKKLIWSALGWLSLLAIAFVADDIAHHYGYGNGSFYSAVVTMLLCRYIVTRYELAKAQGSDVGNVKMNVFGAINEVSRVLLLVLAQVIAVLAGTVILFFAMAGRNMSMWVPFGAAAAGTITIYAAWFGWRRRRDAAASNEPVAP